MKHFFQKLPHVLRFLCGSPHYRLAFNEVTVTVRDKTGVLKHRSTHRNLRTNAGTDFFNQQLFAGTVGALANYLALTATSSFAPAITDTTLSGELTTNGLARASATVTHTSGTGQTTLTHTWTYTGSTLVTFYGVGVLNASSGGTLVNEVTLPTNPTVQNSGDTVAITYQENY